MSSSEYRLLKIGKSTAMVQPEIMNRLMEVDAVIFDCDGVLVDVRFSYNEAIRRTVSFFVSELTGTDLPEEIISPKVIHFFKRSGGYNNDCDLTYAILLFFMMHLPRKVAEAALEIAKSRRFEASADMKKRFLLAKDILRSASIDIDSTTLLENMKNGLEEFAKSADVCGLSSIEKRLINRSNGSEELKELIQATKRLFMYPGGVHESLLTWVFEELFCGPDLFQKAYGSRARFQLGRGLIENERVIVSMETLNLLAETMSNKNFGIASGRQLLQVKYVLGDLLKFFDPDALVCQDYVLACEQDMESSIPVALSKPNPFSLVKCIEALKPFRNAIYVGDSMEDLLMTREANKRDNRFIFTGVYRYSEVEEELLSTFLANKAELILPTVNELPQAIQYVKELKNI